MKSTLQNLLVMTLLAILPQWAGAWNKIQVFGDMNSDWNTGREMTPDASVNDNNLQTFTFTAKQTQENEDLYFYLKLDNTYIYPDENGNEVTAKSYYDADGNRGSRSFKIPHNTDHHTTYTIKAEYKDAGEGWHWYLTVTGTGGGSSHTTTTETNTAGYYLYGPNFMTNDPKKKMYYKLLRKFDDEYYLSINACDMSFSFPNKATGNNQDFGAPTADNSFRLAFVDAEGNVKTYGPGDVSANFDLTDNDANASTEKNVGDNNYYWHATDNEGMYTFNIKLDDTGTPVKWSYTSTNDRMVAYRTSSTSNWTTDGIFLSPKGTGTGKQKYNKNFFGAVKYTKGEKIRFFVYNKWFGFRDHYNDNGCNLSFAENPEDFSDFNIEFEKLSNHYASGVYPTEFNPDRGDFMINGNGAPTRIFIIGSAVDDGIAKGTAFKDMDKTQAIQLTWSNQDQAYMATLPFTKGENSTFRFLVDHLTMGDVDALDLNLGEDDNSHNDTWDANRVLYNTSADSGTDIVFNDNGADTDTYTVRFYIERQPSSTSFAWDNSNGLFRYTLNATPRPYAYVSPKSQRVPFGSTVKDLTIKVGVHQKDALAEGDSYRLVYTIDGKDPELKDGCVSTEFTASHGMTYEGEVNEKLLGTAKFDGTQVVLDDGTNKIDIPGNVLTVKALAVRKLNNGILLGSNAIATAIYTFESAPDQTLKLTDKKGLNMKFGEMQIEGIEDYRYFTTYANEYAYVKPAGIHAFVVSKISGGTKDGKDVTTIELKELGNDVTGTYGEKAGVSILPAKCGLILMAKDDLTASDSVTITDNSSKTGVASYVTFSKVHVTDKGKETLPKTYTNILKPQYEKSKIYRSTGIDRDTYYNYIFSAYPRWKWDLDYTADKTTSDIGFWIVRQGGSAISASSAYIQLKAGELPNFLGTAYRGETSSAAKGLTRAASGYKVPGMFFVFDDNTSTGISTIKNKVYDDNWYTLQGVRISKPETRGVYIHNGKKILIK